MSTSAKQKNKGFTLIEIMVAVSIFALVMVVAIGAVLSIVSANKKAQALNSVISNLNFSLEGMMRDLRTGRNYDCGGDASDGLTNCQTPPSSTISFTSSQSGNKTVVYSLGSDKLIYKKVGDATAYPLTASEVTIDKLDFYVDGTASATSGSEYRQPKILIVIQGRFVGFGETKFSLQTFVSQRKLDI